MTTIEDAMVQELKDISLQRVGAAVVGPPPVIASSGHRVPSSTSAPGVRLDPEGLIIPKKIPNPCVESREAMDLNREIKWNAKTGINVLASKSELQKVMEKRNQDRKIQEKLSEKNSNKTPFQIKLEERAKRLEQLSKGHTEDPGCVSEDSGHCSPEPESEFLKVHAQLLGKGGTA